MDSGIISTPMLTVIAISVVSGFVIPDLDHTVTVFRFLFLIAGGFFGLAGISLLGFVLISDLCSQENYGVPVMASVSPFSLNAMRDVITRSGFRRMQNGGFTVEKFRQR